VPTAVWAGVFEERRAARSAAAPAPARAGGEPLDEQYRAPEGSRRPRAVTALPPGGAAEAGPGRRSGDEPPHHVRARDAELRRELDHLRALERENRRVAQALNAAGGPLRRGSGDLIWPVNGSVVSPFGQRWGRLHAGVDITGRAGTPIRAAATGQVAIAGPMGGYGNYVCIQHTARLSTCYAHLSRFATRKGEVVRQGQVVGLVGCTGHCFGDHLHFETRVDGRPVDPMRYL
jgi:murein DD-endopeptidase MepM/ murein hydrolase activator NlpD